MKLDEIYSGTHLLVQFNKENNRFINSWKKSPDSTLQFKHELLEYRNSLEKINPTQIIWLQQNFTFHITDEIKMWVEENILKPRFKAGFVKIDNDGFHPIAFVVGRDILTHMEVMGVFDEPSPSVLKPKHFATEQEAIFWLDKNFTSVNNNKNQTKIEFKGIDEDGNTIIEFRKSSTDIESTIKSFKGILEENEFIKDNLEKFSLLTKREREILFLIGQGKTQKEISNDLFISEHTVHSHSKKINKKLKINKSHEIIKFYNAFSRKK